MEPRARRRGRSRDRGGCVWKERGQRERDGAAPGGPRARYPTGQARANPTRGEKPRLPPCLLFLPLFFFPRVAPARPRKRPAGRGGSRKRGALLRRRLPGRRGAVLWDAAGEWRGARDFEQTRRRDRRGRGRRRGPRERHRGGAGTVQRHRQRRRRESTRPPVPAPIITATATKMEVVSAEVNSLLPEEIMDTGITLVEDDGIEAVIVSSPIGDSIPMETELEEIVNISSTSDSSASTTATVTTEPVTAPSSQSGDATANTTTPTPDGNAAAKPTFPAGLHKLGAQTPVTISANQIILNKTTDIKIGNQSIKPDGQKLIVTTLGKSGQPIVLALPHSQLPQSQKTVSQAQGGDSKVQGQQIKVVIGGRSEVKPVVGVSALTQGGQLINTAAQPSVLQSQQVKTVQAVKSAVQTITVGGVGTSQFKTIIPLATAPNVQQIQVPGSKFHYVRLVTATTASSSTQSASQNPSTNTQPLQQAKPVVVNTTPVRMSVPIVPAQTVKQVVPKPINSTSQIVTTSQPQQRLIMPATPLPQIQPNLTNLPPGTVLAPAPGTGNVGYAVLPAQYVTQLQQSSYVSIASNTGFTGTSSIQSQARLPFNGIISSESANRPRKPCNCTKSLCLKLYCDCFANGEFCNNCNCTNCYNNLDHENDRQKAIKACLDRNPEAFKPKIGKGKEGESDRRHSKGCNCKRSGCLKNYCECYEAKIMCSSICKCIGCKNFEESPERKTLMHLADAAEVRVQQQTAAKTKLSSQISDLLTRPAPALSSGGGKLPFTFVTKEVADATCECLLAQAEQAEKTGKSKAAAERMILEEFGRCLMRVISSAGKSKGDPCAMNC
ncbi:protein lin-54 homolog isoform X4 [Manacus candei]|uniref:protein lin-54 homolog isoform X4 n=1 Tax=Manacus candei TaxID=415023 RepID=UPI002227AF0F|nr:protein lin-54 homolog isoform X4 [Manacus candei]